MPIFRRKNCIHIAPGIVDLCKRLHSTQSFPEVKAAGAWQPTPSIPRSRKSRAIPLLPLWALTACYRVKPYLYLTWRLVRMSARIKILSYLFFYICGPFNDPVGNSKFTASNELDDIW